jgi:hypothetical protein
VEKWLMYRLSITYTLHLHSMAEHLVCLIVCRNLTVLFVYSCYFSLKSAYFSLYLCFLHFILENVMFVFISALVEVVSLSLNTSKVYVVSWVNGFNQALGGGGVWIIELYRFSPLFQLL